MGVIAFVSLIIVIIADRSVISDIYGSLDTDGRIGEVVIFVVAIAMCFVDFILSVRIL